MAGKTQIGTHKSVRKLQRTLYQQAKKNPKWRAWSLYAELSRKENVEEAMSRILSNRGGSGVDGYTVEAMEADWERFRDSLQKELKEKTYRPSPVKRIRIPKANGGERELGIPTVKDRVVQMIVVLLIEPIFEAGFHDESYGYRPRRKAGDAIGSICAALYYGKTTAIEEGTSCGARASMWSTRTAGCMKNWGWLDCPNRVNGGFESELVNHFGKPDAGEPHVRFDERDGSATGAVPTLQMTLFTSTFKPVARRRSQ